MLSRFDTARFAKVRALYDQTDNPGERASAERAMRALAEAAGLSLADALLADALAADAPADRSPSDPMRAVFDTPRQRAEREQRRRIVALVEQGSSDRRVARELGVARSVVRAVRRAMLR